MKERLLGAAVLVLAAVLIIPALLDGPDRDDAQVTRELALPAPQTATTRTHVVDLGASQDTRTSAETASSTGTDPEPQLVVDEPVTGDEPVAAVTAPAAPAHRQVEPPAVQTRRAQSAAPPPAQVWAVQVGSFTSETNARRLAGLLQSSDYPAFVARNVVEGRVMYRVRVGPEPDRERAEALAERLREDRQQTQLVRHP